MRTRSQFLFVAAAIGLVASAAPTPSGAQPAAAPTSTRSYVQVYRLHPDMVNEWMALQKDEVIPAQKKGGVVSRTTLVTVVGNGFEKRRGKVNGSVFAVVVDLHFAGRKGVAQAVFAWGQ